MSQKGNRESLRSAFAFLFPNKVVKQNHLSSKDLAIIRGNQNKKISAVCLLIATVFVAINIYLFIYFNQISGGHRVETYGLMTFIGQIINMTGCLVSIAFSIIGLFIHPEKHFFNRWSINILYGCLFLDMCMSIAGDARGGLISSGEGISPSIVLIIILLLVQQAYGIESFIMDIVLSCGLLATAIVCSVLYNIASATYYYLIATFYPFARYFIRSFIFYSEVQSYCQTLLNERLYNTAIYDELTKCKNRYALKEYISYNLKRWKKDNVKLLIIMFDIDDFKVFNDRFSHTAGDFCLKSVADSIRAEFSSPDLDFFRYGGEEFLLFFELNSFDEGYVISERVRKAVEDLKISTPKGSIRDYVTISVGARMIITNNSFEYNKEIQLADEYLYKAKDSGKDICCVNGKIPPRVIQQL